MQSTPANQNAAASQTIATAPAPITELARQWTSLQQIFALLTGHTTSTGLDTPTVSTAGLSNAATPAQASNAPLSALTPQSISAGLMVFMSALREGDFRNWLGKDNAQMLEEMGHGDLIKKAEGEFTVLAKQFTTSVSQQWQSLFFPVAVEGTLQQVRLFVKRDRDQKNDGKGKKNDDTRFVIEVDLTNLGELQMDGFVRRQDKQLQFDMVIRSLTPLAPQTQQDILRIYNDTGQITGYKGSLAFQPVREFPVNPMKDIVADHLRGVSA